MRAAVYSHHHIDHVFGTRRFEAEAAERGWPAPVVYAHEELPDHFRRYERTQGWNTAINQRQFGLPIEGFSWPAEYRDPDVTYRDHLTFRQGGLTFELHHARGETDDATWTFVPELGVLHPGDLFIWAVPNAGNPQKVQRFASDWATALRKMAGCGAELMLAGHGMPIFGADRISQALTDTADLLDAMETQTVALMNDGVPLDRVLHEVVVPEHLRELPYLRPVYDHPQFLVRNVWRRYGGWYDGEPDNLLPAPRAEQAREWVTLAGGLEQRAGASQGAGGGRRPPAGLPPRRVRRPVRPGFDRGPRGARRRLRRPQRRAGVVDGPQHPRPRRPRQPRGQARPRRPVRVACRSETPPPRSSAHGRLTRLLSGGPKRQSPDAPGPTSGVSCSRGGPRCSSACRRSGRRPRR